MQRTNLLLNRILQIAVFAYQALAVGAFIAGLLLARSDYVVCLAIANEATENLIGQAALARIEAQDAGDVADGVGDIAGRGLLDVLLGADLLRHRRGLARLCH